MNRLTDDQLEILRELEQHGGVLIIRRHANFADYDHLEKVGYLEANSVNVSDTRYEITERGRAALRSFNY